MKHGKRPTRAQKMRLQKYNLNPDNWLIVKDCSECFVIVNKITGKIRTMRRSEINEN